MRKLTDEDRSGSCSRADCEQPRCNRGKSAECNHHYQETGRVAARKLRCRQQFYRTDAKGCVYFFRTNTQPDVYSFGKTEFLDKRIINYRGYYSNGDTHMHVMKDAARYEWVEAAYHRLMYTHRTRPDLKKHEWYFETSYDIGFRVMNALVLMAHEGEWRWCRTIGDLLPTYSGNVIPFGGSGAVGVNYEGYINLVITGGQTLEKFECGLR